MDDILIHPQTEADIQAFLTGQTHALLLHGPLGSGKKYLGAWVGEQLLHLPAGALSSYPYFLRVSPDKNSIGIEATRELDSFLKLKTVGRGVGIRRVIIIEDAHLLTIEAQNSLLKNLEEPPSGTAIILTAVHSQSLLPTIYSRVQQIGVLVPDISLARKFWQTIDKENLEKAYALSGGKPALLSALVTDAEHPLTHYITQAKQLLRQSPYDRLLQISSFSSDKDSLRGLLSALKQIALAGLTQASQSTKTKDLRRWHRILRESLRAEKQLDLAVNTRLLLTDLLLNL